MVLECSFDQLVKEVGSDDFMNVCARKVICKRLRQGTSVTLWSEKDELHTTTSPTTPKMSQSVSGSKGSMRHSCHAFMMHLKCIHVSTNVTCIRHDAAYFRHRHQIRSTTPWGCIFFKWCVIKCIFEASAVKHVPINIQTVAAMHHKAFLLPRRGIFS
jgi:hypothetical protein